MLGVALLVTVALGALVLHRCELRDWVRDVWVKWRADRRNARTQRHWARVKAALDGNAWPPSPPRSGFGGAARG